VLGASTDTQPAQRRFREKQGLLFTLLCDTDKRLVQAYDVYKEKNMYGRKVMGTERTTFLIDEQGKVAKVWAKVKPASHAAEVLEALRGLS